MIVDLRGSDEIPALEELFKKSSTVLFLWDTLPPKSSQMKDFLSPAELDRLSKISSSHRKNQFLSSRYYCKNLLASFLGIEAASLNFAVYGEGKLKLPESFASSNLDFNYSHTDKLFLLGISNSHDIGVDAETQIPGRNELQVAEKVFSSAERKWIGLDLQRFYRLWSLKEAVIKTVGGGVFRHAQKIEFTAHDEKLALGKIPDSFGLLSQWQIFEQTFEKTFCAWALKARKP